MDAWEAVRRGVADWDEVRFEGLEIAQMAAVEKLVRPAEKAPASGFDFDPAACLLLLVEPRPWLTPVAVGTVQDYLRRQLRSAMAAV